MHRTENLAGHPEFAPVIGYADNVRSHLSVIRGRTVIPPKSRSAVIGKHEAHRAAEGVRNESESPEIFYIFSRTPPSRASLTELKKIALNELRWCEVARGRVLIVRILVQPCVIEGALCAVIEDESGAVHNLRVHNIDFSDARNVLPFGATLAIKEPYCEAVTEATSGIRVDHPSDLVYLYEGDPHFPEIWRTKFMDSEKLKDEGNELFKKGSYRSAIYKYTSALHPNPSPPLKTSVLLNRAQSCLHLRSYNAAIRDAEKVVKESGAQPNEKALFRGARALYALDRYEEAQRYLEQLIAVFPQNREAKSLLEEAKQRQAEQQYAKYDWPSLIDEVRTSSSPRSGVADYMGPIALSNDGLLVSKRDIKAGELLLCSKAVGVLYPSELKDEKRRLIYDATTNVLNQGEGWKLTQRLAEKAAENSTIENGLFSLLKGLNFYDEAISDSQAPIVDGRPVVDIHILESIRDAYSALFPTLHPAVPTSKVPVQGLGLWLFGTRARLGHSCLPNACRSFIGDVLIVRACRDILQGETVTISHVHPSLSLEERRAELSRHPSTKCDCKFCEIEEKDGAALRKKREDLVLRVKDLSERAPAERLRTDAGRDESTPPDDAVVREVVKEVSAICDELESTFTYPTAAQPRFALLEPLAYLFACYLYLGQSSTEDALKANARYLTSLGFSFEYTSAPDSGNNMNAGGDVRVVQHGFYHPFILNTLVQQSSVCWQLGKRRTAEAWRRIAENSMEIIAGHRRLFREGYARVYESLKWPLY